jgi:hypothetical protein
MAAFDDSRRAALELLADARAVMQRRFGSAQTSEIDDARARLLDGRLTTVVVGEFKRGKSTLLGALVEDPELFPVNVDIATNLVTSVEYGPTEQIVAYLGEGAECQPASISREQLPQYVTEQGNRGNARRVSLVRITVPSPRLEAGLVLLDTPGAGGLNTEHTAVTYAVLSSADVALFVLDALTPLTTQELSLLSDVARQAARIMVVITKIDRVPEYESAVDNARAKIAQVLGAEVAARTPVVPVSSAAKLDWLRTGDEESLEVSNFPRFESQLWSLLTGHGGAVLVARALGRLIRVLDDLAAPLDAEVVALTASTAEIHELTAGLDRRRDELTGLSRPVAGWRSQLISAFDEIRTDTDRRLGAELTSIGGRLDEQLCQPRAMDNAQRLLADLQREVAMSWSGVVRDVRRRVAELSDTVEATTGLRPNPVLAREGALTAFDSFGRRDRQPGESAGSGFAALEWLGEVLAFVMGDISVFVVSRLASFFGVRAAKAQRRSAEFAEDVRDQLVRVEQELRSRLADLLDSAQDSVAQTFLGVIDADQRRLTATRGALQGDRGNAERIATVQQTLAELRSLRARAQEIVDHVAHTDSVVRAA